MSDTTVIIVAAGEGNRLGNRLPKQFLKIAKKSILYYTLDKFGKNKNIDEIILVVNIDYLDSPALKDSIPVSVKNKNFKIVAGGKTRQHSVKNGLGHVNDSTDIIMVHDGVRPFVSNEIISANIKECQKKGAILTAIPVTDTLKKIDNDCVADTLNRKGIWQAQTPQTFNRDILEESFRIADQQNIIATDEAGLVERFHKIFILKGDKNNFKITYQEDLVLARALMKEMQR